MPEHSLDVDFVIVAQDDNGDVPVHPRMPNVVSRRGHKLKIVAVVRDLPDAAIPSRVTVHAEVFVLNNAAMGDEGDVSRPFQSWGVSALDGTGEVTSRAQIPFPISVMVSPTNNDDHLGQGPDYQASVDVNAAPTSLSSESAAADGSSHGEFIIPFSSR